MTEQTLYRFWRGKTLLYVGVSVNAYERASQHKRTAGWWDEADSVTFEHFHTREAVLDAERVAIRNECPKYNIVHNRSTKPSLVDLNHLRDEVFDNLGRGNVGQMSGMFGHIIHPPHGPHVSCPLFDEGGRYKLTERPLACAIGSEYMAWPVYQFLIDEYSDDSDSYLLQYFDWVMGDPTYIRSHSSFNLLVSGCVSLYRDEKSWLAWFRSHPAGGLLYDEEAERRTPEDAPIRVYEEYDTMDSPWRHRYSFEPRFK